MATATLTISPASPADIKPAVPHLTARDSVRPSIEHDGRQPLQYGNTGPGQPDYGHRSSEDNAAQYTSPPNNKVALPPLSQQQPLPPQPASLAPAMGPLSSQVIVPARPKPGRKPLPQEDAVDRRRVQNRMAQRNFRDKRAQRVSELTVDNDRLRREMEAMTRKHENQLENQRQEYNSLKRKVSDLEKDLDAAVKRAEDAENKLHSVDSLKRFKEAGFPNPVLQTTTTSAALPSIATNWRGPASSYTQSDNPSIMTPPDEGWPETDMTNFWTSRNADRNQPKPNEDNNAQWLGSGMDIDRDDNDGCGFCTDESNCSCLQSKKAEPVAIAPGGCDACIRDPARAEACRALAAKTEFSPLPTGGSEQRNDSMAPPPPPSGSTRLMSCSKFIDRVETQGPGLRVPSISELFGGLARQTIHSYPSSSGAGAGYDVNEQEAAQVLQSMSRRPSSARLQGRDAAPAQAQAP
ncbi:hypothetical protein WHR41_01516 [Cladosporium halotolerans]|uniref:BZIP domain-containing protein n=1 Tax=Cladosporium halotolerans TaxID=1052096 RepID=A0AB34KXQ3_9PEZI